MEEDNEAQWRRSHTSPLAGSNGSLHARLGGADRATEGTPSEHSETGSESGRRTRPTPASSAAPASHFGNGFDNNPVVLAPVPASARRRSSGEPAIMPAPASAAAVAPAPTGRRPSFNGSFTAPDEPVPAMLTRDAVDNAIAAKPAANAKGKGVFSRLLGSRKRDSDYYFTPGNES